MNTTNENNTIELNTNDSKINLKLFILDPLSVIIKLAILGNKPVGTKILIQNNVIYFQEPGIFQPLCRYVYNSNKTDIQYLYNPIEIACKTFLTKDFVAKKPRMKQLFTTALAGLKNLMETYKNTQVIVICLHYYYAIIMNHMEGLLCEHLFYKDGISYLYTNEIIDKLNSQWSDDKIKVIMDLNAFLNNDNMAAINVKSLENIMESNDKNTEEMLKIKQEIILK
jgi:hypothetical protein